MSTAARTDTIAWGFRARFRRGAFGWKGTQLAIGRINEALTEIRAVARHDTACAAEGAVLLLEKLSPALCPRSTAHRAPWATPPMPRSRNWRP